MLRYTSPIFRCSTNLYTVQIRLLPELLHNNPKYGIRHEIRNHHLNFQAPLKHFQNSNFQNDVQTYIDSSLPLLAYAVFVKIRIGVDNGKLLWLLLVASLTQITPATKEFLCHPLLWITNQWFYPNFLY